MKTSSSCWSFVKLKLLLPLSESLFLSLLPLTFVSVSALDLVSSFRNSRFAFRFQISLSLSLLILDSMIHIWNFIFVAPIEIDPQTKPNNTQQNNTEHITEKTNNWKRHFWAILIYCASFTIAKYGNNLAAPSKRRLNISLSLYISISASASAFRLLSSSAALLEKCHPKLDNRAKSELHLQSSRCNSIITYVDCSQRDHYDLRSNLFICCSL